MGINAYHMKSSRTCRILKLDMVGDGHRRLGAKGTAAEICAADFEREDVAYAAAHMQKAMGLSV